jgi:hypothetical protein
MREIKFHVIIFDDNGKEVHSFHEWVDGGDWWSNHYKVLTLGTFSRTELGDGFMGEFIRRQYIGHKDKKWPRDIQRGHHRSLL